MRAWATSTEGIAAQEAADRAERARAAELVRAVARASNVGGNSTNLGGNVPETTVLSDEEDAMEGDETAEVEGEDSELMKFSKMVEDTVEETYGALSDR